MFINSPEDLQHKTLAFFGRKVRVEVKPGTRAYDFYGRNIQGNLKERVWGWSCGEDTVVAICLTKEDSEITINCADIENIYPGEG